MEPEVKRQATVQVGSTGLNRWSGSIYEEFLPRLQGPRGMRVYREMRDNDPVVGAILFAIDTLLRQSTWRVEPYSQQRHHQRDAEFVRQCMADMEHTWDDFISEVLSMLPYGWSFSESVYKRRGGDARDPRANSRFSDQKIGWRKFAPRAQDTLLRWEFADHGEVEGWWQLAPPDFDQVFLPMSKGMLFRTASYKNNPEGRSVLRNAYRAWFFKKRMEEVEGIGVERDLAGLPVAWVPAEMLHPNATDDDKAIVREFENMVTSVKRDEQEGLVLPMAYDDNGNPLYKFELLSTGGTRQQQTDTIIQRYDQRIAMTIMADFILLGHSGGGSHGLSDSKTGLFRASLRSWLDSIAEVINRFELPRLFALNGMNASALPKLVPGEVDPPNLQELGNFIQKLVGAGMPLFPDEQLENYVREAGGLPPRSLASRAQDNSGALGSGGGLPMNFFPGAGNAGSNQSGVAPFGG